MNIDDTALKTVVAKAIFDGITPDQRQELLTKAINSLLTVPPPSPYGSKPSTTPLQDIFENEVRNLAREAVRERFKTDPQIPVMISGIVTKAIASMAANDSVGEEIGAAIAKALSVANSKY